MTKARLPLLRIVEMNIGFFGLQFSFGLQQANMTPIYRFLGADEVTMPLLWLAGPMTGLIVQPLIGSISDRTTSKLGRRTPYFLIGAVICSLCLLAMPYSPTLWIAASLLWLLDAGNNITMEPYRAYVADRLQPDQQPAGFLTQSAFTGLAQCASYAAPSLLAALGVSTALDVGNGIPDIVKVAFLIGAVLSLASIVWSVRRVPELPLEPSELEALRARPSGIRATLADIALALREMPPAMRRLAVAMLCQWYAMFVYWQYVSLAVSQALYGTTDAASPSYLEATLLSQKMGVLYNAIAFTVALALIPVVRRFGVRWAHAVCLAVSGLAMIAVGRIGSPELMYLPMIGIGIGWAGMMGNPYVMLAQSIPPERNGIYMGIFNMFIVIPMLIETLTMPLIYRPLLSGDPRQALALGGLLMLAGALATLRIGGTSPDRRPELDREAEIMGGTGR